MYCHILKENTAGVRDLKRWIHRDDYQGMRLDKQVKVIPQIPSFMPSLYIHTFLIKHVIFFPK